MRIVFFIMIGFSIYLNADFYRDTDGVITDSDRQLEWQDNIISSQFIWEDAISYCEALSFAGHEDWRLPNINELKTIVDRNKQKPSIVNGFVNTGTGTNNSYEYWSSTTASGDKTYAWYISFDEGYVLAESKNIQKYVRCVR